MDHFIGDTENRLGVLAREGWLSHQPLDFQRTFAGIGRWRRFDAGEVIYLAGDEPEGLYGLGEGVLEASFPLVGEEPVALHRAEPGFWIGEVAILAGQKRMVSLTSVTESRVFFVPAAKIRRMINDAPSHLTSICELSFINQQATIGMLAEALSLSPRARVARLLLRLADDAGSVQGSQEELGRVLGMTRSSIRRAVSSLTDIGAIRSGYGKIVVIDRGLLQRLTMEA
jgi:CRP-like cAMP-binding protein